jgi:hypothetical protein
VSQWHLPLIAAAPNPTLSHERERLLRGLAHTIAALRRTSYTCTITAQEPKTRCPNSPPIATLRTIPVPRHPPSVKNVSEQVRPPHVVITVHQRGLKSFGCPGHFTYECKDTRPYVSRPSRTAQLENPQLLAAVAKSKADVNPSAVPEDKFVLLLLFSFGDVCLTHRC